MANISLAMKTNSLESNNVNIVCAAIASMHCYLLQFYKNFLFSNFKLKDTFHNV
jgi:hypothetical protein